MVSSSHQFQSHTPLIVVPVHSTLCSFSRVAIMALHFPLLACSWLAINSAGNFHQDRDIAWGDGHASTMTNFLLCHLTMPQAPASSPRTSISLERSTCNSSSFLGIQPALSLLNMLIPQLSPTCLLFQRKLYVNPIFS